MFVLGCVLGCFPLRSCFLNLFSVFYLCFVCLLFLACVSLYLLIVRVVFWCCFVLFPGLCFGLVLAGFELLFVCVPVLLLFSVSFFCYVRLMFLFACVSLCLFSVRVVCLCCVVYVYCLACLLVLCCIEFGFMLSVILCCV